jgi:hypothetical protein
MMGYEPDGGARVALFGCEHDSPLNARVNCG